MIVCDYDELVKALREHAEWMGPNNYELPIAMYDDLLKAADAIENLSMKLRGDEAAIAGMKREIERTVVNAAEVAALAQNRFDRLLAENDDLRKRLAETGKTLSWISVKDQLPEQMTRVLVHFHSGANRISEVTGLYGSAFSFEAIYGPATHWMPLPEPPEVDHD